MSNEPAEPAIINGRITKMEPGELFALDPTKPDEKNHLKFNVVMENGDKGVIVGAVKDGPLSPTKMYRYRAKVSGKGTNIITLLGEVVSNAPSATPSAPAEKVAPALREPAGPMAPVTEKAPVMADSAPRKGKVKIVRFVESIVPKDDPTKKLYKYMVTMEDGAHGVAWGHEENQAPFALGQEITYSFGKVYGDGTKRIDQTADGSAVDNITIQVRTNSLRAAIDAYGPRDIDSPEALAAYKKLVISMAKEFEQHILRVQ